ncbi:HERV-H LTR-associating protein 2 isoform X2 [Mustela lutreola]|uniref:HERV-H LTR-associating protein 2 isoform X2 n=1 Tax=Mustela lutreola TaxID=9666 RepID=UPI002797385F|nr:HERV-H LTR-associating protein 2 isoform X2 [Mustela lutreola]
MKVQAVLSVILILVPSLSGFHDTFLLASPNLITADEEQIVIGRLGEDIILPCSFESEPEIVIHWKNQDNNVHSYYKGSDHLEAQDHRYTNRTSLFHGEMHKGNASLSLRRLSLLDEGIYLCYVGTTSRTFINKVVLKVGAFVTPVMKYEKRNTESLLICCVSSYPHPHISWKTENTTISESNKGEIETLDPLHVDSMINITGSNLSYECGIENSLLNQTWTGRWTMKEQSQSRTWIITLSLVIFVFLAICIFCMFKRYNCSRRERSSVYTERANTADAEESKAFTEHPASSGK